MKIHWEIDDGYCGGSRPQSTEIDNEELAEYETEEEKEEFIQECLREDFNGKVSLVELRRET